MFCSHAFLGFTGIHKIFIGLKGPLKRSSVLFARSLVTSAITSNIFDNLQNPVGTSVVEINLSHGKDILYV